MPTATAARTRRHLLTHSTAAAAGALAAACAPAGSAGGRIDATRLAAQKNAQLEVWVHGESHAEWQKKALQDYNKEKGSSVTATWTKPAETLVDKLIVTLAAGSGFPDLADIEVSHIGKVLKASDPPLVALNEYLRGKENDFFKPSAFDPWSANGKYYGIGSELNVCLMAYRHDLLERAGIKAPLATWDAVLEAGKKLVGAGAAAQGMFVARVRPDTTGYFHVLAVPAGGGLLDKDNKLILNDPNNVKALQFLADLINRHQAAAHYVDSGGRRAAVDGGQVAGEIGPTWQIAADVRTNAPDTAGRWTVQPLPQWSASGPKRTTSWGGTGMTVLKNSKNRDVGLDFVLWEHTNKTILYDYDLRQTWPTYKKVYDDPRLSEPVDWFNKQKVGALIRQEAENMLPFYQGVWWPEISTAAGKHIQAALMGTKAVRQALDEARAEAKAAIETAGGRFGADGRIQSK